MQQTLKIGDQHRIITSNFSGMAQVTNVKPVETKEQKGVLVEYLVENYGQSADFFVPDGVILDGQIDSRRARSGMPVEYMSKDGKDFDWGQYSEDVEIQKKIANAFIYSFASFRKQGRGLYIYSNTKGSGKTLLACCLVNEVLKKQDLSVKFTTIADYVELARGSKNEAVKEQMNAIMNTGLLIIDDIGATKEDNWISDVVYRLVNRRYEDMLPTIYTSNVMIDNLKCDDRISSRIMETSTVLAMPEFSVRKKKADERNEAFLRGIL